MKIELSQLHPGIYHARFDTRHDMCSTMVRIAEFYESPHFHGKVFTLNEFKQWYKKSLKKKRFTYYEDWSGYNVPSKELRAFEASFDDISPKEKRFLKLFDKISGPFYVIATFKRNITEAETIAHEETHGMFTLDPQYRKEVTAYLNDCDTEELRKYLIKIGYAEKVMIDELNAYITCDLAWMRRKKIKGKQYDWYSKDLNKIKRKYNEDK